MICIVLSKIGCELEGSLPGLNTENEVGWASGVCNHGNIQEPK